MHTLPDEGFLRLKQLIGRQQRHYAHYPGITVNMVVWCKRRSLSEAGQIREKDNSLARFGYSHFD